MKNITLLTLLVIAISCTTRLSEQHITAAIIKVQPKLENCVQYHTILNSNEQFRTTLSFSVSELGKPRDIALSGIGNSGLKQCLNKQINKLKFNVPVSNKKSFSKILTFKIKP